MWSQTSDGPCYTETRQGALARWVSFTDWSEYYLSVAEAWWTASSCAALWSSDSGFLFVSTSRLTHSKVIGTCCFTGSGAAHRQFSALSHLAETGAESSLQTQLQLHSSSQCIFLPQLLDYCFVFLCANVQPNLDSFLYSYTPPACHYLFHHLSHQVSPDNTNNLVLNPPICNPHSASALVSLLSP